MTIVEFLTARLDERESGVREALRTEDYGVSQWDLDDIAAKRRIVQWCGQRHMIDVRSVGALARDPHPKDFVPGELRHPFDAVVLRFLAEVYADHPDYQQEWKP